MLTDHDSFERLIQDYRYELLVHCYRMLGSIEDAEDALQETFLRAWRHLDKLKAQSALRAWLYAIATNVSLDMLKGRKVRLLPMLTHPSADPEDDLPAPITEPLWLDPLPESYLDQYRIDPEKRYEALEHVSLAFLTALQHLPGRQRAILLLCDVLDWKAHEAAATLNMTVIAVNSALQRARTTLKKYQSGLTAPQKQIETDQQVIALLHRYVQAWESADVSGLMALLHEEAALTMPPFPVWLQGRSTIGSFLDKVVFAERTPGDFRLVATISNSSPAFALYQRDATGEFILAALHVLTIVGEQIVQIDDFLAINGDLFSRFRLPLSI